MPISSSAEAASWSGRIAFGAWWLLYSGPVARTERHAHHAFQIVLHSGGPLLSDGDAHVYEGPVIVIQPDAPHAFVDERGHVLIAYVDPECSAGLALRARDTSVAIRSESHPVVESLAGFRPANWAQAEAAVSRILSAISPQVAETASMPARHPAVDGALLRLPDVVEGGVASVRDLAEQLGLSSSRLSHLFSDQIGIPLRSYARWLRLVAATEALANGCKITAAAHRAGFADGAHFSRTFRSMFGLTPSEAIGLGTWLEP